MLLCLCACTGTTEPETTETTAPTTHKATEKYEDSKFVGKWYNTFSTSKTPDFKLLANGKAVYKGETEGKWKEVTEDEIEITLKIDGEARKMQGYFIIAGDGFSCRATPENQHYLDDGEGELQLEIMLTENTCIDCVKK